MTAPLTRKKQLGIVKLFFEGYSYDEIGRHLKVSKASVEMVVARLREGAYEEFRDIADEVDVLRETAVLVRKHLAGDVMRCFEGAVAWAGIRKMGIEPSELREVVALYEELTPPGTPTAEFVRIALECERIRKELGVDLEDLIAHLETLKKKRDSLQREVGKLESEVGTTQASVDGLRTELSLLQDIDGLRTERHDEESALAAVHGRREAALRDAKVTEEVIEKFRVFLGSLAAKGLAIGDELLNVLLGLVASLGAEGIRRVANLAAWLASEQLGAQEGVAILVTLKRYGFNPRQAAAIVRALSGFGSFTEGMKRLMAALDQFDTVQAAVEAKTLELKKLEKEVSSKRDGIVVLQGTATNLEAKVADLRRQEGAAKARIETQSREAGAQLALRQREADSRLAATENRRKDLEGANRRIGRANIELADQITAMRKQEAELRGNVERMTREEAETKSRLAAVLGVGEEWERIRAGMESVRTRAEREKEMLGVAETLEAAIRFDEVAARKYIRHLASEPTFGLMGTDPWPRPQAAREALVGKTVELLGDSVVRQAEVAKLKQGHDTELVHVRKENEVALQQATAKWTEERNSLTASANAKDKEMATLRKDTDALKASLAQARGKAKDLEAKLAKLGPLMPEVGGKKYENVEDFHRAVEKVLHAYASGMFNRWKTTEIAAGRLAPVGSHTAHVACPRGHGVDVHVTPEYVLQVAAGSRSGAVLGMNWRPGIAVEACPTCSTRFELRLEDLFGA